jgi:hypothetical protein
LIDARRPQFALDLGQARINDTRNDFPRRFVAHSGLVDRDEAISYHRATFHPFADYNWDVAMGCPSFVSEAPSGRIARDPALLDDVKIYCNNLARWLAAGR